MHPLGGLFKAIYINSALQLQGRSKGQERNRGLMFDPRTIKAACVGVVVTFLAAAPSYAAGGCASAEDVDAFAMRDLQSRLMVAGLACGQRDSYNAFVNAHQTVLARTGARLKSYFLTNEDGIQALDRHVTRVANVAARTHGLQRAAFCAQTAALFDQLKGADQGALVRVARQSDFRTVAKPAVCMAEGVPQKADVAASE